jgi:hypothetical protein
MSWELVSVVVQVFCTLAIFSFLYRDNPVYKFVEHLFVGVATGWWIVLEYRDVFLPNLWDPLAAGWTGAEPPARWGSLHLPLVLGLLLFLRLSPRATYLARWSMAVIVGTYAGLAIIGFGSGDLFNQIRSNIIPLFAPGSLRALVADFGLTTLLEALRNPVLVVGLISVLVYFFFSVPHRGAVGGVATVGIWFLMVSFGASYGNTVMARISLFIGRASFLLVEETGPWKHGWITLALAAAIVAVIWAWERRRAAEGA